MCLFQYRALSPHSPLLSNFPPKEKLLLRSSRRAQQVSALAKLEREDKVRRILKTNIPTVFTLNSDVELMKKHQLTPFISIYHQHLVFIAISYCSHQFIKQNRLTVLRINSRFIENIVEAQEINKIDLLFTLCQNRLSCILNIYSSQLRGPFPPPPPSPLCFSHVFMIAGSTRWPWEILTTGNLPSPASSGLCFL